MASPSGSNFPFSDSKSKLVAKWGISPSKATIQLGKAPIQLARSDAECSSPSKCDINPSFVVPKELGSIFGFPLPLPTENAKLRSTPNSFPNDFKFNSTNPSVDYNSVSSLANVNSTVPTTKEQSGFSFKIKLSDEIDITNKEWKLHLPDHVLEQLRCSFCNNYMSHFPIHLYMDKQQIGCGRCTVQSDHNPIQLPYYEAIAKFLFFSCRYKANGCTEHFQPNEIPAHEEFCSYKQYSCPSYPIGSCNWQGYAVELYAHYEADHKKLALDSNCQFDIDLTIEHKQNYLVMKYSECFVIHVDCDSEIFRGSVSYFSTRNRGQQYRYGFHFKEHNYSITPHDKMHVQYGLVMDFDKRLDVCFKIHDINLKCLSSAICFVTILPYMNPGTIDLNNTNSSTNDDTLEDKLLAELECPCCMEPMLPPIIQCIKGHSICSNCIKSNTACLTCGIRIQGDIRNFNLEKITILVSKYPCKFFKFGCSFVSTAVNKPIHEETCLYLSYTCPLEADKGCKWEGILSNILEHAKLQHPEEVLNVNTVQSIYSEDKNDCDCFIYNMFGQLFRVMIKSEKQHFFWSVQFIGPANDCNKFVYMLDFVDASGSNQRWIIKRKCSALTSFSDAFIKDGYICIPVKLLKSFVEDNCITYKFSVIAC